MVWLLNVKLGAVQSTYMAKLSCAFPQHIVRIFRRLSCAHGGILEFIQALTCAEPDPFRQARTV